MQREIISKKTRLEFREFLVGWTLREIEIEFKAASIPCQPPEGLSLPSGQRRSLVERYYASLDLTKGEDAEKLLRCYEYILHRAQQENPNSAARLAGYLEEDGFVWRNGKLEPKVAVPLIAEIREHAKKLDAEHMAQLVARMERAVEEDPSLAIGSAKELVETCCRTILSERRLDAPSDWDLPRLVKDSAKTLRLTPADIPSAAKGADTIKRILGSLSAVVKGLAELRNLYGTGHGKEGKAKGLTTRHARLAVGCASTLATFMLHTHTERR